MEIPKIGDKVKVTYQLPSIDNEEEYLDYSIEGKVIKTKDSEMFEDWFEVLTEDRMVGFAPKPEYAANSDRHIKNYKLEIIKS